MSDTVKKVHAVDGVSKPRASYSTYTRIGNLVFTSGQVAMDPETGEIPKGFSDQLKLILENIRRILESAGTSLDNVVKTTVFLKDPSYHAEYNEIYSTYFKNGFPARSTVAADLMHEDFLAEIEAVAWVPE
jgi:2-iminobutanoate/2-iminopropanoate deaminase